MIKRKLYLYTFIFLLSLPLNAKAQPAVAVYENYRLSVFQLFENKDYRKAFLGFERLAHVNDKFSQYHVAAMYALGLGVKKDLAEAYAWATLSRENTEEEGIIPPAKFDTLLDLILERMPPSRLEEAEALSRRYFKRYGSLAIASRARLFIRRDRRSCPTSLLGANCHRPTPTICYNRDSPTYRCLLYGVNGIPGVRGFSTKEILKFEAKIKRKIEFYSSGTVKLRPLEVIEDE